MLGIFSGNLLRGEPITIFGDGEQTRDFVFIDDIVEGWVRALHTPASAGGVFNLGSGRSLSINQLAQSVIAAFGHPPGYKVIRAPARPGEQRTVQADIRRARAVLGWQPRTTFEDGTGGDRALGAQGVRRPLDRLEPGGECAMKLLLVISVDPWTRSVSTVHKYVATGRALGHEVAVYGPANPELPGLPFTTELSGVDLALFVVQVPTDFPDMPLLARLLDGIPRERRAVVDLWGRFNDTIRVEHDFNHLEKLDGHLGWEWEDAIRRSLRHDPPADACSAASRCPLVSVPRLRPWFRRQAVQVRPRGCCRVACRGGVRKALRNCLCRQQLAAVGAGAALPRGLRPGARAKSGGRV